MKKLQLDNISIKYQKKEDYIIENFSFTFLSQNIYLILGENGIGKSTLVNAIAGIIPIKKGKIIYDNVIINHKDVAIQTQNFASFPTLKVKELIKLFFDCLKTVYEEKYLYEILNIESLLNKKIKSLSGGQKKLINLYLTFCTGKNIIILDEPMAGLDLEKKEKFTNYLENYEKSNKIIIIISHEIKDYQKIFDKILLFKSKYLFIEFNGNQITEAINSFFGLTCDENE